MNILGITELVIDCILLDEKFLKYQGGGTSHNVIYQLIDTGNKLYIGGVSGNDIFAIKEIESIEKLGIDISLLEIKNKKSRKVFTKINSKQKNTVNSVKCDECGKDTWSSSSNYKIRVTDLLDKNIEMIIFDSYKNDNNSLAFECKKHNIVVVLDWGVIGNLRYLNIEKLKSIMDNPYNIIQINSRVASFLKSRFNLKNDKDLFKLLNVELLVVTYNKDGSRVIFKDSEKVVEHLIAFDVEYVNDTNGAGDSFLASVIESYKYFNLNKDEFLKKLYTCSKQKVTMTLSSIGARPNYLGYEIEKNEIIDGCYRCGTSIKKVVKSQKFKLQSAIEKIEFRVINGLNENMQREISNFINSINNNLLIIGQGASYVAGTVISEILNEKTDIICKEIYTNNLYSTNISKYKNFLILSSSGTSPDTQSAIKYLQKNNKKNIFVITAKEKLINDGVTTISYYHEKWTRERGFISIESILIPSVSIARHFLNRPLDEVLVWIKEMKEGVEKTYNFLDKGNIIDIFYDSQTYSVALDLESKFIESGLGRVTIHEKKNFSHGRFSILKTDLSDKVIYLNYNNENKYEQYLINYLMEKGCSIIKLSVSEENDLVKKIKLLILNQYFFNAIGNSINRDLSNPTYDSKDEKIYKYKF